MKKLLSINKNLLVAATVVGFSHTAYSVPSLTSVVTGLSRACSYAFINLVGSVKYQISLDIDEGTILEKPIKIDESTQEKLKVKLAPDIDFDHYNKAIYVTDDGLGATGKQLNLRKYIELPVNPFQKSSVYLRHFMSSPSTDKLTEKSGELLTDEDLDMCCVYIKRDVQFEKSGAINRSFSKLPLPLALLPTICTPFLYCADKKLTAAFASGITKSLIAAPVRIAIAAGLGVALARVGNIAAQRVFHHFEEEKDKYIDQKDVPLFKKHLEATLKYVQSGNRVGYSRWSTWFDKSRRYQALMDSMQRESLERRVKALTARSKIDVD
jgi:hypothetical protein